MFVSRRPLITRVDWGLYKRFAVNDGAAESPAVVRVAETPPRRSHAVDIDEAVGAYHADRSPNARFPSFDYCFNHFQQHRSAMAAWGEPSGMEISCLHLGFYLASWGMLRGSSDLHQRSVHHLVPLVETIATASDEVWDLDLDGCDTTGIDLIMQTAHAVRHSLRPVAASDILVTKIMLGVFGCVPAFDTNSKKGFGVSTFSKDSLRRIGELYRENGESGVRQRLAGHQS